MAGSHIAVSRPRSTRNLNTSLDRTFLFASRQQAREGLKKTAFGVTRSFPLQPVSVGLVR